VAASRAAFNQVNIVISKCLEMLEYWDYRTQSKCFVWALATLAATCLEEQLTSKEALVSH